ncbi:glycosyltransferase family 2 protein [Halocola ammonii]
MAQTQPHISIVIPLFNEEESLEELHRWIVEVMGKNDFSYEIVFVDDGSTDRSWLEIEKLSAADPNVRAIRFLRNYGKSAGLNTGFEAASGKYIITMDADLQDSPEEIPEMIRMIEEEGLDLVSGWKKVRHDPPSKTIPTKLYNFATRKMSGIYLHDFNCGLKAYRSDVVKSVEIYGEMHRYIPVIAKWEGFSRIGEKVVQHRERKYGKTKFGLERFINGFLDLLTITFVSRFGKKPMHLFGTLGTLMFIIGFLAFAWIGGSKLYYLYHEIPARNIANDSKFFIALTAMILGTQLFLAGFIGELVSRNSPTRNTYKIKEQI